MLHELSTEAWNRVIAVNLNGVFFCSRAALPVMQSGGGGVIVSIASIDGQAGMATVPHYVATKHAVIGLTRNIALEYGAENIRAVAVAPGLVDIMSACPNTTCASTVAARSRWAVEDGMVPISPI